MLALALARLRLWDGTSEGLSDPVHLRIEGERIAAIGADPALLEGAQVLEFGRDAVAIPGLIDAHVHMTLDPAISSPAEQLARDPEQVMKEMESRALAMVRAGITTARDLGGGAWLELGLRDRIARGEIPGPRLLCAGQPLTTPGGHCHFWGGVVSSPEEIRASVRLQAEHGADCIKVMATGGVITRGSKILEAQFSREELDCVRQEAARLGRRVAAHCHGTAGIRAAVAARLRTIEHCSFAGRKGFGSDFDREIAGRVAARDTWVSPTVNAGWKRFLDPEQTQASRFLEDMRAVFKGLRDEGVRLIASSDAGIPNVRHHDLPRALAVMREFTEQSCADVLRAATSQAARALELEGVTGRLHPGLEADLLVVSGDPLRDLDVLESPRLVLARGELQRVPDAPSSPP